MSIHTHSSSPILRVLCHHSSFSHLFSEEKVSSQEDPQVRCTTFQGISATKYQSSFDFSGS